jgi:CRISPR-associated exonuclease Cas4
MGIAVDGISAGDLEKFCYCPLSWSLRDAATDDPAMVAGRDQHDRMAGELEDIIKKERLASSYDKVVIVSSMMATAMALVGVFVFASTDYVLRYRILSVMAILWIILAIFILYGSARARLHLEGEKSDLIVGTLAILAMVLAINAVPFFGISSDQGLLAEVVALLLLMGATIALYLSQHQAEGARKMRDRTHVRGRIAYIGESGSPRLLHSEEHALSGRPDYILDIEGGLVPVEVKTGRVPRGPLFSHVIQLAAYCLLLENEGKVSYGILKYGDVEHIIAFDEHLRSTLLSKMADMREVMASGEAHRNHDRPGKCRSCSRRERCPERLD